MKRLVILAAVIVMAINTRAQIEDGDFTVQPKVGMNIATLSDADKSIVDLHFGVEFELMVSDDFSLGFGALLSNQGAKYEEELLGKYTADLDYVQVLLLVNCYLLPGLAVKAGVQPGFKMRAKAKFDESTIDLDDLYKSASTILDEDIKVNAFDLSIPVGLSYEFKNFVLDARYNFGLLKVINVGDAFYNRAFMLSLGYKLNL